MITHQQTESREKGSSNCGGCTGRQRRGDRVCKRSMFGKNKKQAAKKRPRPIGKVEIRNQGARDNWWCDHSSRLMKCKVEMKK